MEEQQDTIFVSGISEDTTEEQLKEHFGAIGLIKVTRLRHWQLSLFRFSIQFATNITERINRKPLSLF